ncbi:Protein of unknown function [Gryllus bimaculatus]|nr:Protein of unknown function [Gryllus bimaculatus]
MRWLPQGARTVATDRPRTLRDHEDDGQPDRKRWSMYDIKTVGEGAVGSEEQENSENGSTMRMGGLLGRKDWGETQWERGKVLTGIVGQGTGERRASRDWKAMRPGDQWEQKDYGEGDGDSGDKDSWDRRMEGQ